MASSSALEPESWLERSVAASVANWHHATKFQHMKESLVNTIHNKGGDYTTMQAIILADIRDLERDIGNPAAIVTFTDKNAADKVLKLVPQNFHKLELADVKIRRAYIHTQGQDAEFLRSKLRDDLEKKHGIKVQHDESLGIFFDGYRCQINFIQRKLNKTWTLTIGKKEQESGYSTTTAVRTQTETTQAPGGQDMARGDAAKRSDRSADLQHETDNTVTCSKIEMLYILKQWGKEGARNGVYKLEPAYDASFNTMEGGIRVISTGKSKAGQEEGMQYIDSIISAAKQSSGVIRKYMFQFKCCGKASMVSKAPKYVAEIEKLYQDVALHRTSDGIYIMGQTKDAWACFLTLNEKFQANVQPKSVHLQTNVARYIAQFDMESIENLARDYELDYMAWLHDKPCCVAFILFKGVEKYPSAERDLQRQFGLWKVNISMEKISCKGKASNALEALTEFARKHKVLCEYSKAQDIMQLTGPQTSLDTVANRIRSFIDGDVLHEKQDHVVLAAGTEDKHPNGKVTSAEDGASSGYVYRKAFGHQEKPQEGANSKSANGGMLPRARVKTPPTDYPGADTSHSTGTRSPDVQDSREASLVTAKASTAQSSQTEPLPQSQTSGSLATPDSHVNRSCLAVKPPERSGTSSPISAKHDKSVSSCPSPTTTAPTPRPNLSATKENSSSRKVDTAISSKGVKTTEPKVPGGAVRMVSSTSTPDSADVSKGSSTARTGDSSAAKPQIADPQGHRSDTRSQRSDAASQRSDAAGQRSNKAGQGSDAAGQRSVTGGQRPGAAGQRSDATGQGPDTQGQRSDTPGQGSDTRGQSDAAGQRSDAAGQRSGAAGQGSGTAGQRSDAADQRSGTTGQGSGAAGQRSDAATPSHPTAPPRSRRQDKVAGDVASPQSSQDFPILRQPVTQKSAAHIPLPVSNDEFDEEPPPPNVPATTFVHLPSKARVHALVADITKATTVAIVSASNWQLKAGGGVAKAIADAAGPELMKDCARYIQKYRALNVTDNCITRGGELNAKYVIHAVGPSKRGQVSHEKLLQDLQMTFVKCLDTANNSKCYTIAIPAISSGNFGVPLEDAAREMVAGVLCFLDNEKNLNISDIFLVDVRPEMVKLIHQNLKSYDALKLMEPQGVLPTDGATLVKQCAKHLATEEEDSCVVCMSPFTHPMRLKTCGHTFCHDCLVETFSHKPSCPVCNTMYGTTSGSQPDSGRMTVEKEAGSLPGYHHSRTIVIDYNIPSGVQQANHPNPGEWYKGSYRQAFLPNNQEGKEVLKMLQRAFEQRLVFTIGRSSTTGKENVVTWNDIHHKTRRDGGPQKFGYPDPTYLARVKEELAAKGIKEED